MTLPIFKVSVAIALTLSASMTMSMTHAEVRVGSSRAGTDGTVYEWGTRFRLVARAPD